MIGWDTFVMALRAISRNKVRSVLTALGIVIGVGSVIAMVHLGQAATRNVTDQIASMGSNLLMIRPDRGRGAGGVRSSAAAFEIEDAETIAREIKGITVAPLASAQATLVNGAANASVGVTGTSPEFLKIRNWSLAEGRIFEPREELIGAPVCVLGQTVVTNLYAGQSPLGATLRIGDTSCQVIGILEKKGESMGQDQDDVVIMPTKTVQRRLSGSTSISQIYVSADEADATSQVQTQVERLLRERRGIRPGEEDDFRVRNMQEIAQTLEGTTNTLTALLGAIAAVSLLVGGIGIMNIMLVSVTERTREIGIRMAIGALARDVLMQFLIESIIISTIGGAIGVAIGVGGTWLMTQQMKLPFALDSTTILMAFSFSAVIGVVFGFVPARKAALLKPIDALRHE